MLFFDQLGHFLAKKRIYTVLERKLQQYATTHQWITIENDIIVVILYNFGDGI